MHISFKTKYDKLTVVLRGQRMRRNDRSKISQFDQCPYVRSVVRRFVKLVYT